MVRLPGVHFRRDQIDLGVSEAGMQGKGAHLGAETVRDRRLVLRPAGR
jgi:hypothetical protein